MVSGYHELVPPCNRLVQKRLGQMRPNLFFALGSESPTSFLPRMKIAQDKSAFTDFVQMPLQLKIASQNIALKAAAAIQITAEAVYVFSSNPTCV